MSEAKPKYPLLILDTASKRTWVGIICKESELHWVDSRSEPSKALFQLLRKLQAQQHFKLSDVASIAYNEGPGSTLGIRIAVMAIRSWLSTKILSNTTIFAFNSLAVGLTTSVEANRGIEQIIVTDARRNSWNALSKDKPDQPRLIDNTDLESIGSQLFLLNDFPRWTKSEANLQALDYRPESCFARPAFTKVLREVDTPQPAVLRQADYQKWVPRFKPQEIK
ncbi:hypothetical protein MLD52_12065 [Puniceicoccaceae bacterium K14]|nr:hypothetical protein [Puniceicoccaceae bacterium K14]